MSPKPCPFCGKNDLLYEYQPYQPSYERRIECRRCEIHMTVIAWNNRPIEGTLHAEIAALKEKLEETDE